MHLAFHNQSTMQAVKTEPNNPVVVKCSYTAVSRGDSDKTHSGSITTVSKPNSDYAVTHMPLMERAARPHVGGDARISQWSCDVQPEANEINANMASNCKRFNFNLSEITSNNNYACVYHGEQTFDGVAGRALNEVYRGRLMSCDAGGTDPQTMRDIQTTVAKQVANGSDTPADVNMVQCRYFGTPM